LIGDKLRKKRIQNLYPKFTTSCGLAFGKV